jgi:cytochrome c biogenesis protein ResB
MVILMNANLDFFSGLSMFNSPSQSYIWILAATLLISLIILFVQNKNSMWLAIKTTAIITTALILAFSPWAYKNIQEIEQISITGIIQGRTSIHLIQ